MDIVSMYSIGMDGGPTTGYLLWRVATKWRAAVDRAVSHLGLTHAQYSLLASLYGVSRAGRTPSQRELADITGLEPIFVSKLARALESGGLVARDAHPGDTRAVQLRLTDRGTAVVREAVAVVAALQDELTASIGGTAGRRNRELAEMLADLLNAPPVPPRSRQGAKRPVPDGSSGPVPGGPGQ
jgi:DNA-binding MarR family transcriptional regulator